MNAIEKVPLEPRIGLLHDPLADWSNDDILLTKPARAALSARHLHSLRVLDWPELRQAFNRHDQPANKHGRIERGLGLAAIGCAAVGLVLAAFTPVAGPAVRPLGALAALFTLAGVLLAALRWRDSRAKARWLGHRYWTERVRSLYFQTIVNNLGLVARAMEDDAAFAEWKGVRARALAALPAPEDLAGRIRSLTVAPVEDEVWLLPDWTRAPDPPEPTEQLEILLDLLRGQRFDVQLAYTDRKLSDSLRAPKRRSQAVRWGSAVLPAAAAIAAAAGGMLLTIGEPVDGFAVKLVLAFAFAATVVALALRVLNDDLLLSDDAARYAWYSAAVTRARARFDAGDVGEKVAALREMEAIAYKDLRAFVAAHWRARQAP